MAVAREAFAVGDVETQVVSLVGRRLFVQVNEDDEGDAALDGDGDVGVRGHRHLQPPTPRHGALVAGEDQPLPTVQDDSAGCDLQVRPLRLVDQDGDGAEVGALLLVAAWGRRGPNQLSVHRHTWKAEGTKAVVRAPSDPREGATWSRGVSEGTHA